jgi:hypothetical protein
MSSPRRLRPFFIATLILAMLPLVGAGTAHACDPDLIDAALSEADAHLGLALRAGELDAARVHLRRVAHAMGEAEAQFISCNCQNAPYEAASAAADARRAASAQEFADMAISIDAAISGFQLTVMAMQDDLCR